MNKIKKFKNGNVNITFKGNMDELEEFYNDDMFMDDLHFYHDGSDWFLIDTNKNNVYFIDSYAMNIFEYLQEEFKKSTTIKLYASNDKEDIKDVLNSFLN